MRKASREMVPLTWRFHHRPHLILTPPESVEVNGQSSKSRVKLAWTMPSRAWRRWNINHYLYSTFSSWIFNWYSGIFFFLCGQKEETRKNREHAPAVEQMGFPVSGCGTRGFAAQTVLARDDTEKPHLLPTAPAIVRPANTPPLVVADLRNGFDYDLFFFSDRFELARLE